MYDNKIMRYKEPLTNKFIIVYQICPPYLYILLGLVKRHHDMLLEACHGIDVGLVKHWAAEKRDTPGADQFSQFVCQMQKIWSMETELDSVKRRLDLVEDDDNFSLAAASKKRTTLENKKLTWWVPELIVVIILLLFAVFKFSLQHREINSLLPLVTCLLNGNMKELNAIKLAKIWESSYK